MRNSKNLVVVECEFVPAGKNMNSAFCIEVLEGCRLVRKWENEETVLLP